MAAATQDVQLAQSGTETRPSSDAVDIRFGRHADFDRLVFEWSEPADAEAFKDGAELTVTFDRAASAGTPPESAFTYRREELPQLVFALRPEDQGRRYRLTIDPDARFSLHRWEGGRLIVIDVTRTAAAAPTTIEDDEVEQGDGEAETGEERSAQTLPPPAATADLATEEEEEGVAPVADDVSDGETEEEEDEEAYEDEAYDDEEDDDEDDDYNFATAGEFELYLGGTFEFGVSTAGGDRLSDDGGDRGYAFFTDVDIDIEAYTTFFDDVDVGAVITLEAEADTNDETANADETYIYLDHAFGEMQIGRTSGAEDDMALGADTIARGTGGIDGDAANLGETQVETSGDAAKITYFTPRDGEGVQFGLSFTPDTGDEENDNDAGDDFENHVGVGLNIVESFGDLDVSLATVGSFGESEFSSADNLSAYAFGGTLGFDPFDFGASYGHVEDDDDFDFATVGISVALDSLGFGDAVAGLGYNFVDEDFGGITHIFVLSGDAPILPGVQLQGDVSLADPEDEKENVASVFAIELGF